MAVFPIRAYFFGLFLLSVINLVFSEQCVEGQPSHRDETYFVCQNGQEMAVACSTVDGVRVESGANYSTSFFVFNCRKLHSEAYILWPLACIHQGKVVSVGSSMATDHFWYNCARIGDKVTLQIGGCVGDNGDRVGPGGIVTRQIFLFRCTFAGTTVTLQPFGCIMDGSHYPAGDIVQQDFWYYCNILQGQTGLELKLAGCVDNGRKLSNGSTITRGPFVYRCDILQNRGGLIAFGCLDDRGEQHTINQTWREGHAPISYTLMCKKDGHRIFREFHQCYYHGENEEGHLDAQCVRKFGATMVKCNRSGPGRLRGEIYNNADDQAYQNALNEGYKPC